MNEAELREWKVMVDELCGLTQGIGPSELESALSTNPHLRSLVDRMGEHASQSIRLRRIRFTIDQPEFEPRYGEFYGFDPDQLDLRADMLDHGSGFGESGPSIAAELRTQAAYLRSLENGEAHTNPISEFTESVMNQLPIVCHMASWDQNVATDLAAIVKTMFDQLCILASRQNQAAIEVVAKIAISATNTLNRVIQLTPELVKAAAKNELTWPLLVSPNTSLSDKTPNWEAIGLGSKFPITLTNKRRFRIRDRVGEIAWKLWLYVFKLRENAISAAQAQAISIDQIKRRNSRSVAEDAFLLPEFICDSLCIMAWWAVAERVLIEDYGDRTDPQKLDVSAPEFAELATAPSHKTSRESRIREKLCERFYSFAGFKRPKK